MVKRGMLLVGSLLLLFLFSPQTASCKEMNKLLEELRNIEFNQIKYNEQRAAYFDYIEGRIPILISAPHGTKHYRQCDGKGYWKEEDAYTSSLAIVLGQLTGAHVLYAKYKAKEDPNNDEFSAYKDSLRKAVEEHGIKFVIDLHGASGSRPFKIDVGTMSDAPEGCSCTTFRPVIEKAFRDLDKHVFNKYFAAGNCGTITSFVRNELGIEAAQFEINAGCRIVQSRSDPAVKASEGDVLDMVTRFQRMILDISESIKKSQQTVQPTRR
jgi:N-formylglutamate amidohydrolase